MGLHETGGLGAKRGGACGCAPFPGRARVPQGSLLGPLLYVLYTAELALVVDRHRLSLQQYADDTQVYISTPAGDAEAAVRRLTACLVDIEAWLKANRLRLNPNKT